MNSSGKIGVVTVTYNSGAVLGPFLHSIETQSNPHFLLYAVDNASKDSSVAQLQAWGDSRLRIISNDANVGVAEGNNQGTRAAFADGCDYVLYLNNDVEFSPETFSSLVEELHHWDCDLISPKILFGDKVRIWCAGAAFNPAKGYLGYHIGEGDLDNGQYETARLIQHAPTCCLLVRKRVFEVIGMMDTKYFVYGDDSDFTFRAWRAGLKMFYTPKALIIHKVSSLTGGATSPFTMRYNTRGHVYFMLKNLGLLRSLYLLPAWQLRLLWKLLSRSIGTPEFFIRERAFFEGIGVWLS